MRILSHASSNAFFSFLKSGAWRVFAPDASSGNTFAIYIKLSSYVFSSNPKVEEYRSYVFSIQFITNQ